MYVSFFPVTVPVSASHACTGRAPSGASRWEGSSSTSVVICAFVCIGVVGGLSGVAGGWRSIDACDCVGDVPSALGMSWYVRP